MNQHSQQGYRNRFSRTYASQPENLLSRIGQGLVDTIGDQLEGMDNWKKYSLRLLDRRNPRIDYN